jgi:hypothetical protein
MGHPQALCALQGRATRRSRELLDPPNYALRLQPSLMAEARVVAKSERISLNQLFNICVAEKLSALRAEQSFYERVPRAAPAGILQILEQARKLKSTPRGGGL